MGKGISPFQRSILAALDGWPSAEQATAMSPGKVDAWARPGELIERLDLPKTSDTRAVLSRALRRLCQRQLVARTAAGKIAAIGKYRYLKVAGPVGYQDLDDVGLRAASATKLK